MRQIQPIATIICLLLTTLLLACGDDPSSLVLATDNPTTEPNLPENPNSPTDPQNPTEAPNNTNDAEEDPTDSPNQDENNAATPAPSLSPCEQEEGSIVCSHSTQAFVIQGEPREVHWQTPQGEPPAEGWPAVIIFQGSTFSSEYSWTATPLGPYGLWEQVQTIHALLEQGFAVLTPEVQLGGSTFWNTNISPWNLLWESSPDHALMETIFSSLEEETFGPINLNQLYAAGISSGGYMTSRMAVSYPGKFQALAIVSGSYATCAGSLCYVPSLPEDHPPTLFLHGALDTIVPLWTQELYATQMESQNLEFETIVNSIAGHVWIEEGIESIPHWFLNH